MGGGDGNGIAGLLLTGASLTHDSWVLLGVVAAALVFIGEATRRGLDDERLVAVVAMSLAFGAVGARAGTWLRTVHPSDVDPFVVHWLYGNRSILSGLVFAWLGVHVGKLLVGYRERTGALFAPAVAAGMAIGRVGCLLTEYPGRPSPLPFGIQADAAEAVQWGVLPGTVMHPTFYLEMVFHALALLLLTRYRDALARPADLLLLYLSGYAAFRFLIEFVRGNDVALAGLTRPQLFILATAPLLAWRCVVALRRPRPDEGMADDPTTA